MPSAPSGGTATSVSNVVAISGVANSKGFSGTNIGFTVTKGGNALDGYNFTAKLPSRWNLDLDYRCRFK